MEAATSKAYDRLETLGDPSHTHALTREEFAGLIQNSGLVDCRHSAYGVTLELEVQLKASFPAPDDEVTVRAILIDEIGEDRLGIRVRREEEESPGIAPEDRP